MHEKPAAQEVQVRSRVELALHLLDHAHGVLRDNVASISLDEALLVPDGGYRSILGTLKHAAAWSHVYRSFAFDPEPTPWNDLEWPGGLRDTVEISRDYLDEVISWFHLSHALWMQSLGGVEDEQLDLPRPLHWGQTAPLFDTVVVIAGHHIYHAGEINQLLAISRGEAWEEGEEVEENHISTIGHRVRPPWLQ